MNHCRWINSEPLGLVKILTLVIWPHQPLSSLPPPSGQSTAFPQLIALDDLVQMIPSDTTSMHAMRDVPVACRALF